MGDKPTAAMVLSLIGGIFVILGGAFIAFVGSLVSSFGYLANGGSSGGAAVTAFGVVGIIMGLIMIVGSFMLYSKPTNAKMWGIIILILSILSWVTAVGGLVIGFILGLIGGILAIMYKPSTASATPPPAPMGS
ncbi:MAG TPA: DUF4064 domain-containing protein [Candidatus Bathyarchaeia archaeon]|nr:DUF4064 domain-containing protein [Candidatus Bathyarchaeia archaeon]